MVKQIEIFDSTLRDGAQGEGISFSVQDKLNIVKALDRFGITYIEAGNPGSNPKDLSFFEQVKSITLKNAKLCAFGSTARAGIPVQQDKNVQSLLSADTPTISIFGKSWDLHVTEILKISLEENLKIVRDTISYLKSKGKELIFDAEHFFDGYKENPEYALSVLNAAVEGGADCLCLCDTNGGTLPDDIKSIVLTVTSRFPNTKIGIHCHNDIGCAVASSMSAVAGGATQIQGTFVGFGERCGNADLSTIIANLTLKCGMNCNANLPDLYATAREIAAISNVRIHNSEPYVGKSAFAHKGGMHIDGVQKISKSFEHVDPSSVGNERKFLLSEVSGRGTVLPKLQRFLPGLTKHSPETTKITEQLKEQEFFGYQYEGAEASFELFVKKQLGLWTPHFNVIMYKTNDDYPAPDGELQSSALVKIEVDGKTEVSGDIGNGPVNALDNALRKALVVFYPEIKDLTLTDFKVRVIDSTWTTAAKIRVMIESTDNDSTFTTIGVSNDIIEASFIALMDSFEYKLSKKEQQNNGNDNDSKNSRGTCGA
jgi:2-isopropylmalate synthase